MPTITEQSTTLYAFCPDGACPGYECEAVEGIAREVSRSAFEEAGPDCINGNAISTSFVQYLVPTGEVDETGYAIAAELPCDHCDRIKHVSIEPRPEYANMSGRDPMELLHRRKDADRARDRDIELAELKGQLAVLMSQQNKAA